MYGVDRRTDSNGKAKQKKKVSKEFLDALKNTQKLPPNIVGRLPLPIGVPLPPEKKQPSGHVQPKIRVTGPIEDILEDDIGKIAHQTSKQPAQKPKKIEEPKKETPHLSEKPNVEHKLTQSVYYPEGQEDRLAEVPAKVIVNKRSTHLDQFKNSRSLQNLHPQGKTMQNVQKTDGKAKKVPKEYYHDEELLHRYAELGDRMGYDQPRRHDLMQYYTSKYEGDYNDFGKHQRYELTNITNKLGRSYGGSLYDDLDKRAHYGTDRYLRRRDTTGRMPNWGGLYDYKRNIDPYSYRGLGGMGRGFYF